MKVDQYLLHSVGRLWNMLLCDRAAEELERINDNIKSTLQHYSVLHKTILQAMCSLSRETREKALITRRIIGMELVMKNIWKVACKHVDNTESMPSVMDEQMNASSEVPAADLIATECDNVINVDSDQEYDSEEN
jgi:hypothetical protein